MIHGFRFSHTSTVPSGITLLGLPLEERQERAFLEAGGTLGEAPASGPAVALREDVAVTAEALQLLVEAAKPLNRDVRWKAGGRHGQFVAGVALDDGGPWLVYLTDTEGDVQTRIRGAEELEIDVGERLLSLPFRTEQADAIELPIADALVVPTAHWVQHLWANLLGMGPFLWRTLAGRNIIEVAFRVVWAAVRARSIQPARLLAKLNRRGRNVRIHPSAVVEGCWIGDGVDIGAGAVVRGCILADGTLVEDQAFVEFSVLAPGARVQRQAMCKFSVLGVQSAMAGAMQMGVLEQQAQVKYGAVLMDVRFGGPVRVQTAEGLFPAPLGVAGVHVGARTQVGAGVSVAPGRALPADLVLVPGANLVEKVGDGSGVTRVKEGRLVPL